MLYAKTIGKLTLILLGVGLLIAWAVPTPPHGFCDRDVRGRYTFASEGEIFQGALVGEAAAIGYIDFDGSGTISFATQSLNIEGQIFNTNQEAFGTYTIDPDGTGTMAIAAVASPNEFFMWDIVLINKKEIIGVSTNPGQTLLRTVLKKQR